MYLPGVLQVHIDILSPPQLSSAVTEGQTCLTDISYVSRFAFVTGNYCKIVRKDCSWDITLITVVLFVLVISLHLLCFLSSSLLSSPTTLSENTPVANSTIDSENLRTNFSWVAFATKNIFLMSDITCTWSSWSRRAQTQWSTGGRHPQSSPPDSQPGTPTTFNVITEYRGHIGQSTEYRVQSTEDKGHIGQSPEYRGQRTYRSEYRVQRTEDI